MTVASRRRALAAGLLVLAYLALAIVFTYPLVLHFATHHVGEAGGDAKVYLWNYWWTRRAVTELGVSPLSTHAIFYPIGIGLALHTLALLQGLCFIPLSALAGDVAGANVIVVWTFVASALGAYALARTAGADRGGAFLAGIAFGYCPYRLARLSGHYDLLGTEWIPFYALVSWKLFARERASRLLIVASGALAAACGYTSLSYLVFLALFTALLLAFQPRRLRTLAPRALATGALAAVLLFPLLHKALADRAHWTYPPYPGADRYAADLSAYLVPSPRQTLLGPYLGRAFDENVTETTVFAGYLVVAAGVAGVWLRRRIDGIAFWLTGAAAFFVLSLGSTLHVLGRDTGIPLPFRLFTRVPLLDNLRAPSRLSILTLLCLAVVLALVWTHVFSFGGKSGRSGGRRVVATAGAAAVLVAESIALPVPLFSAGTSAVYARIAAEPDEVSVVEIPGIEQAPVETMYHQTVHGKPIFVGTAARVPREKSEYYLGLPLVRPLIELRKGRLSLDGGVVETERASAPAVARFLGLGYFVIDRSYEKRGVVSFLEAVLPVDRWYEDENLIVLKTRREALPPNPRVIDPSLPESRQHFESGWLRPEREGDVGFRWANRERSTLLFRRPRGKAVSLVLEVAPLEGLAQSVRTQLEGRPGVAPLELSPGWQDVAVALPPLKDIPRDDEVERLWLHWSSLRQASERDPRRLAARVRSVRFE
jgi:hypothetical protein